MFLPSISVPVQNTGKCAGNENVDFFLVQLYIPTLNLYHGRRWYWQWQSVSEKDNHDDSYDMLVVFCTAWPSWLEKTDLKQWILPKTLVGIDYCLKCPSGFQRSRMICICAKYARWRWLGGSRRWQRQGGVRSWGLLAELQKWGVEESSQSCKNYRVPILSTRVSSEAKT